MTHHQGQFMTREVDTEPGARGPFAPPAGFEGDADAYLALMRNRYATDPGARQQMHIYSRGVAPAYLGPYADQARALLNRIRESRTR